MKRSSPFNWSMPVLLLALAINPAYADFLDIEEYKPKPVPVKSNAGLAGVLSGGNIYRYDATDYTQYQSIVRFFDGSNSMSNHAVSDSRWIISGISHSDTGSQNESMVTNERFSGYLTSEQLSSVPGSQSNYWMHLNTHGSDISKNSSIPSSSDSAVHMSFSVASAGGSALDLGTLSFDWYGQARSVATDFNYAVYFKEGNSQEWTFFSYGNYGDYHVPINNDYVNIVHETIDLSALNDYGYTDLDFRIAFGCEANGFLSPTQGVYVSNLELSARGPEVIPEPSATSLGLLSLASLMFRRKRRH